MSRQASVAAASDRNDHLPAASGKGDVCASSVAAARHASTTRGSTSRIAPNGWPGSQFQSYFWLYGGHDACELLRVGLAVRGAFDDDDVVGVTEVHRDAIGTLEVAPVRARADAENEPFLEPEPPDRSGGGTTGPGRDEPVVVRFLEPVDHPAPGQRWRVPAPGPTARASRRRSWAWAASVHTEPLPILRHSGNYYGYG